MTKEGKKDVISGGISGVVVRTIAAPLDVIKIRFQLQSSSDKKYSSMFNAASTIVKEEGLVGLWKGNLSATFLWISYSMMQFGSYGVLKRLGLSLLDANPNSDVLKSFDRRTLNAYVYFLAGVGAGIFSITLTYPFDIMRTHFVLQGRDSKSKGMIQFLVETYRERGPRGLFSGLEASIFGAGLQMGINFSIYEFLKRKITVMAAYETNERNYTQTASISALSGGLSSGISKFCVYPFDTIKKRLQAEVLTHSIVKSATNKELLSNSFSSKIGTFNIFTCFSYVYKTDGLVGLYKGLSPTIAKAIVTGALSFSSFEVAKKALDGIVL